MVPLVIAPHGGQIDGIPVQRTFSTARSVEFDTLLVPANPAPAADALGVRDAKAGAPDPASTDPRVALLVNEAWRHAKAVGGWGPGAELLETLGYSGSPGVVTGDSADDVLTPIIALLGAHRVWERFPSALS